MKQPPQRRESFDTCPSPPGSCPELDESLEEKPKGPEELRSPESEGESSTKSEPTTPKAGRASLVAPGRSPKAARSRAEKCAGVHISGPFSVTVPFHITSNLSRLTRGLPCPALDQGRDPPASPPPPAPRSHGDPQPCAGEGRPPGPPGCRGTQRGESPPAGEGKADAEQTRLSLELRDSFAFLDSQETWLEGGGDGEPAAWSLLPDSLPGDGKGSPAMEEGMESGFMNVSWHGRPWALGRGGSAGGGQRVTSTVPGQGGDRGDRMGTEGTGTGWKGQGWDAGDSDGNGGDGDGMEETGMGTEGIEMGWRGQGWGQGWDGGDRDGGMG